MSYRSIRWAALPLAIFPCPLVFHHVAPLAQAADPEDPVRNEYHRRLETLEPDNVADRYALAVWCKDHDRLDLAAKQCKAILKIDPDHSQANLLLRIAEPAKKPRRPRSRIDAKKAPPPPIPRTPTTAITR